MYEAFFNLSNMIPGDSVIDIPSSRIEEVSATVTYTGKAPAGTLDSESDWVINKIETVGTLTTSKLAEGSSRMNKVWNDRATYTYI